MAEIKWGPELETGIEQIDIQHQGLVEVYNELDKALRQGKAHKRMAEILGRLIDYTESHFESEEGIMAEADYEFLAQHRSEHEQLIRKVRDFQRKHDRDIVRISVPVMKFLEFWLKHHIQESDKGFALWKERAGTETVEA